MAEDPFLRGLARELRRGVLPVWILEELGRSGPIYGYALMERLRERGGPGFEVPPSSLYPVLARMRRRGYVESFHGTESRGPVRKYYRLTAAGGRALSAAMDLSQRLLTGAAPPPNPTVRVGARPSDAVT